MVVRAVDEGIMVGGLEGFGLEKTLFCGQSFRWRACSSDVFEGIAFGEICRIRQNGAQLLFMGMTTEAFETIWKPYFDLDTDYNWIKTQISSIKALSKIAEYAGDIRILRQDPWEMLGSFILSQNNNIKRIEGMIDILCLSFGEPIDEQHYAFPAAEEIAKLSKEKLAPIRSGYRAEYLLDAARRVADGRIDLLGMQTLPTEQLRQRLMDIHGVGKKVADCIALFGFHRLECFPVDVWVGRAEKLYLPEGIPKELLPFAGVLQQMLFHYIRTCPKAH